MTTSEAQCDGCRMHRPTESLVVYRPDGLGDTFTLCRLCRESVAMSFFGGWQRLPGLYSKRELEDVLDTDLDWRLVDRNPLVEVWYRERVGK